MELYYLYLSIYVFDACSLLGLPQRDGHSIRVSITSELHYHFLAFSASTLKGHWQRANLAQGLQRLLASVPNDYYYLMTLQTTSTYCSCLYVPTDYFYLLLRPFCQKAEQAHSAHCRKI